MSSFAPRTFSLSMVKKTKDPNAPTRMTIHGPAKLGKSTFGSMAPDPIFVITEDGQKAIDVEAFPLCRTWQEMMSALSALALEEHTKKTVVIDSMDWAEQLLHRYVAELHQKKSVEDFGYGKGYTFAADHFRELLDALDWLLANKGMNVIAICHSEIKKFDDPLRDSYDRYQMKLHKLVGKMLSEWSDIIGFAQLETFTKVEKQNDFAKTERHIAQTSERRVLHLAPSPSFDAGSRFPMPAKIELDYRVFAAELAKARA